MNKETMATIAWINNDEYFLVEMEETIEEMRESGKNAREIGEVIAEWFNERFNEYYHGLEEYYADLLQIAYSNVDFEEVAKRFIKVEEENIPVEIIEYKVD